MCFVSIFVAIFGKGLDEFEVDLSQNLRFNERRHKKCRDLITPSLTSGDSQKWENKEVVVSFHDTLEVVGGAPKSVKCFIVMLGDLKGGIHFEKFELLFQGFLHLIRVPNFNVFIKTKQDGRDKSVHNTPFPNIWQQITSVFCAM